MQSVEVGVWTDSIKRSLDLPGSWKGVSHKQLWTSFFPWPDTIRVCRLSGRTASAVYSLRCTRERRVGGPRSADHKVKKIFFVIKWIFFNTEIHCEVIIQCIFSVCMNIQYLWYKQNKECAKLGCEHTTCSMTAAMYLLFIQYEGIKDRDKRDKLPYIYHKDKRRHANKNTLVVLVPIAEVCTEIVTECSAGQDA